MTIIKNKRKATINIAGQVVGPNQSIELDEAVWLKEFAANKIVRDAVASGFIEVVPVFVEPKKKGTKNEDQQS